MRRRARFVVAVATALLCGVVLAPPAGAAAGDPTVSPPLSGGLGRPWFGSPVDPAAYGYTETEHVLSGTAKAYGASLPDASYATRIVVYRPADAADFSGTVYVEWNNVTLQTDLPADFLWSYPHVFASGDAYVQVTAQQVGVCGLGLTGRSVLGLSLCLPTSVKGSDPARYRSLVHPGDAYGYDIFSQAGRAIASPGAVDPLGGLEAEALIAVGESQSAGSLDLYQRYGADADARVFDGFVLDADLHSKLPSPEQRRVPNLHLSSEDSAEPVPVTGPNLVMWQIAGAAHVDRWFVEHALPGVAAGTVSGLTAGSRAPATAEQNAALRERVGDHGQYGLNLSAACVGGTEFQRRYVVDAALAAMADHVRDGVPLPVAPALEFSPVGKLGGAGAGFGAPALPILPTDGLNGLGTVVEPFAFVRDADGNARGGLRMPYLEVPVATYDGTGCLLLGTSTPFSAPKLRALYPTHDDYVEQLTAATRRAVDARFMTRRDGIDLVDRACASAIPEIGTTAVEDQPALCRTPGRGLD